MATLDQAPVRSPETLAFGPLLRVAPTGRWAQAAGPCLHRPALVRLWSASDRTTAPIRSTVLTCGLSLCVWLGSGRDWGGGRLAGVGRSPTASPVPPSPLSWRVYGCGTGQGSRRTEPRSPPFSCPPRSPEKKGFGPFLISLFFWARHLIPLSPNLYLIS